MEAKTLEILPEGDSMRLTKQRFTHAHTSVRPYSLHFTVDKFFLVWFAREEKFSRFNED